jgi:hypothetical protein
MKENDAFKTACRNFMAAYNELFKQAMAEVKNGTAFKYVIKVGDIVRVQDCHHLEPHFYEVSRVVADGVVSQPACFHHHFNEITAIYRHDGRDLKCIWQRGDAGK